MDKDKFFDDINFLASTIYSLKSQMLEGPIVVKALVFFSKGNCKLSRKEKAVVHRLKSALGGKKSGSLAELYGVLLRNYPHI